MFLLIPLEPSKNERSACSASNYPFLFNSLSLFLHLPFCSTKSEKYTNCRPQLHSATWFELIKYGRLKTKNPKTISENRKTQKSKRIINNFFLIHTYFISFIFSNQKAIGSSGSCQSRL
jgi:hypothetical protein